MAQILRFESSANAGIEMIVMCDQWRGQPDNLVALCKFQSIIIIHFSRN